MTGVSISRWTMAYFAAAMLSLLLAETLMFAGYGYPAHDLRAPETLVLVHIASIGWLSLLMCGALHQFVPVLVAEPLHSDRLPFPALVALVGGLASLVAGFLSLAGTIPTGPYMFAIAGASLGCGFVIVLWNLGRTLLAARPLPLTARFVAAGLASIAVTLAYGLVFALVRGGLVSTGPLLDIAAKGTPIHVLAGIGGWLTLSVMGVSYRLLAMFMLAPEPDGIRPRMALYSGAAAMLVVILGGTAAILLDLSLGIVLAVSIIPGLASLVFYGVDIIHLYRVRKRRIIELNSRMAAIAFASLGGVVGLVAVLLSLNRLPDHAGAVVFLTAFGWLTGLGLAKLYKIVAFLTWLECYGPLLGKMPTPRVQDLAVESRAEKWFFGYFISTWAATAALLASHPPSFRIAAAGMLVATLGISVQLVRIRMLADVNTENGFPESAGRPHLLFANARRA